MFCLCPPDSRIIDLKGWGPDKIRPDKVTPAQKPAGQKPAGQKPARRGQKPATGRLKARQRKSE